MTLIPSYLRTIPQTEEQGRCRRPVTSVTQPYRRDLHIHIKKNTLNSKSYLCRINVTEQQNAHIHLISTKPANL